MADFSFARGLLADILFPLSCIKCRKSGVYFCTSCLSMIATQTHHMQISELHIFSSYSYANPMIRKIVHDLKYHKYFSSHDALEKLMIRWALVSGHLIPRNCTLIPVPLHPRRQKMRGFNQSENLANLLGNILDLPVMTDLLFRTTHSVSQTECKSREENVYSSFVARRGFSGEAFIVDDVVTSGFTMQACHTALIESNAICHGGYAFCWGNDVS